MTRTFRCGAIALGFSVLFVHAALAQKTSAEFDESVDFSKYKTFAIREGTLRSPNPSLNSELTKKHVEEDIERALTEKKMTRTTGNADLNVFYTLGSRSATETETFPVGWNGRTRTHRVTTTEGNLIIDLRDPRTRSLVWRGVATEEKPNPSKIAEKLDDMVRKLLAKYPPKK